MEVITRYFAIQCAVCSEVLVSRARHDFNTCSCEDFIFVDGDSAVENKYYRIGYSKNIPKSFHVDLPVTRAQMYQDWNKRQDKWRKIDIAMYPPIEIPEESAE